VAFHGIVAGQRHDHGLRKGPRDLYVTYRFRICSGEVIFRALATGGEALSGITSGIITVMAMTLRLDDGETEALRERAEHEGRSMQEVARQAVREYVERTSRRDLLDRVLDEELPRYAEALRRLGE
jgi:plasmid stability protein